MLQPGLINYCVMGDEVEELALLRGVLSSKQLLSYGSVLPFVQIVSRVQGAFLKILGYFTWVFIVFLFLLPKNK